MVFEYGSGIGGVRLVDECLPEFESEAEVAVPVNQHQASSSQHPHESADLSKQVVREADTASKSDLQDRNPESTGRQKPVVVHASLWQKLGQHVDSRDAFCLVEAV